MEWSSKDDHSYLLRNLQPFTELESPLLCPKCPPMGPTLSQ